MNPNEVANLCEQIKVTLENPTGHAKHGPSVYEITLANLLRRATDLLTSLSLELTEKDADLELSLLALRSIYEFVKQPIPYVGDPDEALFAERRFIDKIETLLETAISRPKK